jgi:hypothetical protein
MPLRVLRNLDLGLLVLALPIFLAADWPLLGWAGASGVWLLQRAAQDVFRRRAETTDSARAAVGLMSVSLIGRVWFLAFGVLAIGLIDREAGLAAALLIAAVFQVWFTALMVTKSMERGAG